MIPMLGKKRFLSLWRFSWGIFWNRENGKSIKLGPWQVIETWALAVCYIIVQSFTTIFKIWKNFDIFEVNLRDFSNINIQMSLRK